MKKLLSYLGLEGRISREKFRWQIFVLPLMGMIPAAFYVSILEENNRNPAKEFYFPFFLILPVFIALSILVRRMHDRNKSVLWIALYFAAGPFVGILSELYLFGLIQKVFVVLGWSLAAVGFIELSFCPGSPRENRFGSPTK